MGEAMRTNFRLEHSLGNNAVFSSICLGNHAECLTAELPQIRGGKIRQNFPFSSVENVVKRGAKSQRRNFISTNSDFWRGKNDAPLYMQGIGARVPLLSDHNIFLLLIIIIISIPLKSSYPLLYITTSIFPNERKVA